MDTTGPVRHDFAGTTPTTTVMLAMEACSACGLRFVARVLMDPGYLARNPLFQCPRCRQHAASIIHGVHMDEGSAVHQQALCDETIFGELGRLAERMKGPNGNS